MAAIKKVIKAQKGKTIKATPDSSKYYKDENEFQWKLAETSSKFGMKKAADEQMKNAKQAGKDADRQKFKGKPGFDANGFPVKEKAKSGAKIKDKKWIQKAVNPKHKGYCTPMTKATCTPKRKALAKTFKAMGKARKGK
jgi:hypothetical protein